MKEKEKKNNYEKLQRDVAEEIGFFMKVLKTEIEWLDQHIQTQIKACTSQKDLRNLVKLKDNLDRMTRELRRENYFRGQQEDEIAYLLDGVDVMGDDYFDPADY